MDAADSSIGDTMDANRRNTQEIYSRSIMHIMMMADHFSYLYPTLPKFSHFSSAKHYALSSLLCRGEQAKQRGKYTVVHTLGGCRSLQPIQSPSPPQSSRRLCRTVGICRKQEEAHRKRRTADRPFITTGAASSNVSGAAAMRQRPTCLLQRKVHWSFSATAAAVVRGGGGSEPCPSADNCLQQRLEGRTWQQQQQQ